MIFDTNIWATASLPEQLLASILTGISTVQKYKQREWEKEQEEQERQRRLGEELIGELVKKQEYIPPLFAENLKQRGVIVPPEFEVKPEEEVSTKIPAGLLSEYFKSIRSGERRSPEVEAMLATKGGIPKDIFSLAYESGQKQKLIQEQLEKQQKQQKQQRQQLEREIPKKKTSIDTQIQLNTGKVITYVDTFLAKKNATTDEIMGTLFQIFKQTPYVDWKQVKEYVNSNRPKIQIKAIESYLPPREEKGIGIRFWNLIDNLPLSQQKTLTAKQKTPTTKKISKQSSKVPGLWDVE